MNYSYFPSDEDDAIEVKTRIKNYKEEVENINKELFDIQCKLTNIFNNEIWNKISAPDKLPDVTIPLCESFKEGVTDVEKKIHLLKSYIDDISNSFIYAEKRINNKFFKE